MNLTWHIVKKDLRALKWPLLVWALLIVGKLGVGVGLLSATGNEDAAWFGRMDVLVKVLSGMEFISFILVAALIHEDMLVGTTAFWVTRPISGLRLLQAKLLGIVLIFGLLPVLVTLPWWLYCGYGLREIFWAGVETVAFQAIAVLLGMLWAVVTNGFARFLMWTLVLVFAVFAITSSMGVYLYRAGVLAPSQEVMKTRVAVVVGIALLTILTVMVHQFLTRRTLRSLVGIGVAAVLTIVVGLWWPWSWGLGKRIEGFRERQLDAAWPVDAEPENLKFTVGPFKFGPVRGAHSKEWQEIRFELTADGLLPSQHLYSEMNGWNTQGAGILHWQDGSIETVPFLVRPVNQKEIMDREILTKSEQSPGRRPTSQTLSISGLLEPGNAARLRSEVPSFNQKIHLTLFRAGPSELVALHPGIRTINGTIGERLASVEKEGDVLLVKFVRNYPGPLRNYWFGEPASTTAWWSQYALVNHARDFMDIGQPRENWTFRVGTVVIAWQAAAYVASPKAGGSRVSGGMKLVFFWRFESHHFFSGFSLPLFSPKIFSSVGGFSSLVNWMGR